MTLIANNAAVPLTSVPPTFAFNTQTGRSELNSGRWLAEADRSVTLDVNRYSGRLYAVLIDRPYDNSEGTDTLYFRGPATGSTTVVELYMILALLVRDRLVDGYRGTELVSARSFAVQTERLAAVLGVTESAVASAAQTLATKGVVELTGYADVIRGRIILDTAARKTLLSAAYATLYDEEWAVNRFSTIRPAPTGFFNVNATDPNGSAFLGAYAAA